VSDDPRGKAETGRWRRRWREVWWMFWICWVVGAVLTAYLIFWQQPQWERAKSEAGLPAEALSRHNDETQLSLVGLLFLLPLVAFALRWLLSRRR